MFLSMLGSGNQSVEDAIAGASVLQTQEALGEFNECAKKGCSNEGTHLCKRCQIASYCSRSCQKADWKSHKKACKKSVQPLVSSSESTIQASRSISNAALRNQDAFLRKNPEIDYRIVLPHGSQDAGVVFGHPMGQMIFRMYRSKPDPPAVFQMYKMLAECKPDKATLIRRQLSDEYGFDPLGAEAQNASLRCRYRNKFTAAFSPICCFIPRNLCAQVKFHRERLFGERWDTNACLRFLNIFMKGVSRKCG